MSVSGVDRKRSNGDENARTRQDYQERETEQTKRYERQLQTLRKQHADELHRLQESYDKARTDQTESGHRILSDRDRKYQAEMDELKKMHVQRMKEQMEKYDTDTHLIRDVKDQELQGLAERSSKQIAATQRNSERAVLQKDEEMRAMAEEHREAQTRGMLDQKKDFLNRYNKEMKQVQAERKERVGELDQELTESRESHRADVKNLNADRNRQLQSRDRYFMQTYEDQTQKASELMAANREGHQEELKDAQRTYSKELNKRGELQKQFQSEWADVVKRRQDDQVAGLERNLHNEKNASLSRENNVRRLAALEKKHLQEASQDRLDEVTKRHVEGQSDVKEQNRRELTHVVKRYDDIFNRQIRENQDTVDQIRSQEVIPYKMQAQDAEARERDRQIQASGRDKKIADTHRRELEQTTDFYKSQITDIQRLHENQMKEQRAKIGEENAEIVGRLKKQLKDQDVGYNEKLANTTNRYENQISDMRMDHQKEMRRTMELFDQRLKEQDKRFQSEFDRERAHNISQNEQLRDKFEKEIEFLKKRHEQEKIELAKRKV